MIRNFTTVRKMHLNIQEFKMEELKYNDEEFHKLQDQLMDEAVRRVRANMGSVGSLVCEECGKPIPEARRRAMPTCTRCIECQEKFERGDL